jgi:NAD+ synthetase
LFDEALVTAELDPAQITSARADTPLLADLENQLPLLVKQLAGSRERGAGRSGKRRPVVKFDPATNGTAPRSPLSPSSLREFGAGVEQADSLAIDVELARRWLVSFLRDEVVMRRKFTTGIVALSGGVDSSLTAYLAAQALGPENVIGLRMPYRTSSPDSLLHAQLVIDTLGIRSITVDITAAVDGYFHEVNGGDAHRKGNVMARQRMIVLFDQSHLHGALPLGTGNKSERLLGYFTWHADDSPPVNPLGDLYKTQVWALARHVGVPEVIVAKPATADLVAGQTDEGDIGVPYERTDRILHYLLRGARAPEIVARGFTDDEVALVRRRLESTHWKRRLPTVAMLSQTAIGEFYLRPVDY